MKANESYYEVRDEMRRDVTCYTSSVRSRGESRTIDDAEKCEMKKGIVKVLQDEVDGRCITG